MQRGQALRGLAPFSSNPGVSGLQHGTAVDPAFAQTLIDIDRHRIAFLPARHTFTERGDIAGDFY